VNTLNVTCTVQQKVHIKTVFHKIWQKVAIRTIHINSLVNVLHTVMCTQYNRIQVELRTCTKWTVHVSCGMFRALKVCTPDWFIAVFWSFYSYTGVSLTINHGILHWNTDWLDYYNSPSITVLCSQWNHNRDYSHTVVLMSTVQQTYTSACWKAYTAMTCARWLAFDINMYKQCHIFHTANVITTTNLLVKQWFPLSTRKPSHRNKHAQQLW